MRIYCRFLYSLCGLTVLAALAATGTAAATAPATSGAVIQSYNAASSVLPGMLVELQPKTAGTVEPLTAQDLTKVLGVVVPTSDAAIVLTPQSSSAQQVLVATAGRYNVLVSNQNGPIKSGDYLTISSYAGIGMAASVNQPEIVAQAAANFNGGSGTISTISVKNGQGKSSTVSIGSIPANVRLDPNPLYQKTANSLPGFLNRLANDTANQPAQAVRIGLSAVVLVGTFIITASIFYSGVSSSVVAIGRNPLAKRSIDRRLLQAILTGLIIFTIGVGAAYGILSL